MFFRVVIIPTTIYFFVEVIYRTNADSFDRDAIPGEISKKKCKEYIKLIPDSYECPYTEELKIGNWLAARREFPHTVLLGYKEDEDIKWKCTASLISEEFALTSAHCLKNPSGTGPVIARLGITNVNDRDHLQEIKIKEVILHPEYKRPSVYNDIGLVRLERKVTMNSYVRPACLYTEREIRIDKAINSGWGFTSFAGAFDDRLQKVVLEIYDESKCRKTYKNDDRKLQNGVTYDTMVCAGTSSIVTIQPVTGGPLSIYHREESSEFKCIHDVVGIASFGKPSGIAKDIPEVYTRVSAFISWIEENVWK